MMNGAVTEETMDYAYAIARERTLSSCIDKIVPRKTVVYETLV